MTDEAFEEKLKELDNHARRLRAFWRNQGFLWLEQAIKGGIFSQPKKPSPQLPTTDPSRQPPSLELPEASGES